MLNQKGSRKNHERKQDFFERSFFLMLVVTVTFFVFMMMFVVVTAMPALTVNMFAKMIVFVFHKLLLNVFQSHVQDFAYMLIAEGINQ